MNRYVAIIDVPGKGHWSQPLVAVNYSVAVSTADEIAGDMGGLLVSIQEVF